MRGFLDDLSLSLRRLLRVPGFALATTLILAFGIAISVVAYSLLRGVVFGALPFEDPAHLVSVNAAHPDQDAQLGMLTAAEVASLVAAERNGSAPFSRLGYYNWGGLTFFDGDRPRERTAAIVGGGFFEALAMPPLHGRWFTEDEHASWQQVAVLSYSEWQRLLGGRPEAVGTFIETAEGRLQVVGVMPATFDFPSPEVGAWLPMVDAALASDRPGHASMRQLSTVARLDRHVSSAVVQAKLDAIHAQMRERPGSDDEGWQLRAVPLLNAVIGDVRGSLWSALAIAILVLLIACSNVAILVRARQVLHRQQQALAQALGASRRRLWRSLVIELSLVAFVAIALALAMVAVGIDVLRSLASASLPRADAIVVDGQVVLFAVAIGLLLPVIVVIAGALRPEADTALVLRGAGRGTLGARAPGQRWLPALALAMATISVVVAIALSSSLMRLQQVDAGFRAEGVRVVQLFRNAPPDDWPLFATRLREALAAVPGAVEVSVATTAPLSQIGNAHAQVQLPGQTGPAPFQPLLRRVDAEYLSVLNIPLLAGRMIADSDRAEGEKVTVINREMAQLGYGGVEQALGQWVDLDLGRGQSGRFRIVGIAANTRNRGLRAPTAPEALVAFAQNPWLAMSFLVHAPVSAAVTDAQLADAVLAADPRQATTRIYRLSADLDVELGPVRFFAVTLGVFAALAIALAGFGIYAVAVLQQRSRVREFGLRLAVGARPLRLGRQVLQEGSRTLIVGLLVGLAGAWAIVRTLAALTFELETRLSLVMLASTTLIAAIALLALLLPAIRTMRTDPMVALRHE